jgi:hypothetical protein
MSKANPSYLLPLALCERMALVMRRAHDVQPPGPASAVQVQHHAIVRAQSPVLQLSSGLMIEERWHGEGQGSGSSQGHCGKQPL